MDSLSHPKASLGEQPDWAGTEDNLQIDDAKTFIEDLLRENVADSLVHRGYAIIKLSDDLKKTYKDFSVALEAFCDQPIEEKTHFATIMDDSKHTPNQFHGYSRMEGLKEQYMIRACGSGTKLLFPESYLHKGTNSPNFGVTSLQLYKELDQACRGALYQVADLLNIPHANADRIIDEVNEVTPQISVKKAPHGAICSTSYVYPGYVSSSLLDVFRYGNSFKVEDGSFEKFKNNHASHSDSGILTLVPVADVAGLDVLDQKIDGWIALEKLIHKALPNWRDYGTIFWGDSVEYLTKTHAKALLHRVSKSNEVRYSIVFKMRTKPTATAPRYQEDYGLALMQQRSVNIVRGKKLFWSTVAVGALAALSIIVFKSFQK